MNGIKGIQKAYVRHCRDNGQTMAYVEWTDVNGVTGRTEGDTENEHIQALFARAEQEGVAVTKETW